MKWFLICCLVAFLGILALMAYACWRISAGYAAEAKMGGVSESDTPSDSPEDYSGLFLSLYTINGVHHIRRDQVVSFAYDPDNRTLVINDGMDCPDVIPDPNRRCYARLCQQFGTLPMEGRGNVSG